MKYKVRNLNILDIRSIAKILKEVNITREEVRNTITNVMKDCVDIKNNGVSSVEYISAVIPLIDIILDILVESDSFWDFLKDILDIEDLSTISIVELKNIISTLLKSEELASFFTGVSQSKENPAK